MITPDHRSSDSLAMHMFGDFPLLEADFCIHLAFDDRDYEDVKTWETSGI